jgi:protein-L-isoaspartate O-methyltransferase
MQKRVSRLISFLILPLLVQHALWSSGASDKNKSMVEQLQRYGIIRSSKVAEVMEAVDRGLFVPPGGSPYFDSPMPIGYNATISAPHMHAACLELLEKNLQPGMRALDVGSGKFCNVSNLVRVCTSNAVSQISRHNSVFFNCC